MLPWAIDLRSEGVWEGGGSFGSELCAQLCDVLCVVVHEDAEWEGEGC